MNNLSVCIATYNGEAYIHQQISSILNQISDVDEIIVSDDGSQDNTLNIIKSFEDSRIKVLTNSSGKGKGPLGNFEKALKNAKGKYIFLSDQDDIWSDDKVAVSLELLTKYDLVLSDAVLIDASGSLISRSLFQLTSPKTGILSNLVKNSYVGCCMAFNRSVLEAALPFPKNVGMHDWWIALVAESFFRTKIVNAKLVGYRRHGGNFSETVSASKSSLRKKLLWRWSIVKGLLNLKLFQNLGN